MEFEMNIKNSKLAIAATIAALTAATAPAQALEQGDWIARVGVSQVKPDTDSDLTPIGGGQVDVDDGTSLSINVGYMLTSNIAIDVLAAWPFTHDINGAGALAAAGKLAETDHLPPTVSLQYHFQPKASIRPYVGAGINYTKFFSIKETAALGGAKLTLDDSWGLAAQLGVDFDITDKWFGNLDVRYIQIETEANSTVTGAFDVAIDPWVVGLHIGTTF
jgi:outer membrane protein